MPGKLAWSGFYGQPCALCQNWCLGLFFLEIVKLAHIIDPVSIIFAANVRFIQSIFDAKTL
jgi:hypothetical protein